MPTKNQHFVPRVYLKRWSFCNNDSVYYYKKTNIEVGEPRNVMSILFEHHTYTVTYNGFFTLDNMPKIKQDFADKINYILQEYKAVAFYEDKILNTDELLTSPQNLGNVDKWIFKRSDNINNLAPKKAIVANIKDIRSYVLEKALDDYIEKKWNTLLDSFIEQIEKGYSLRIADEDIIIQEDIINGIISTLLMFMCRNPQFDYQGIFPTMESVLLSMLLKSAINAEQELNIRKFVKDNMRGLWLLQIYRALFNDDVGFFIQYSHAIKHNCQLTVMRCSSENGNFITTDNPAFTYVNFVTKFNYNAIYFPLTPNYLLLICRGHKDSINRIDVKTLTTNTSIRNLNKIILSKSNEAIISNRKYLGYII